MNCSDVRAALPLLIYGDAGQQEGALRHHLAECATCRREQQALEGVRRLLDTVPAPAVEVDLSRLHRSLSERQMRRARRWRRIAVAFGAIAAVLLLALGLRLEVRVDASQLIVRWGEEKPVGQAFQPDLPKPKRQSGKPDLREELRIHSELIHALKQDADDRDRQFAEQLSELEKYVHALQAQADRRWSATEKDLAALNRLSEKGEKP